MKDFRCVKTAPHEWALTAANDEGDRFEVALLKPEDVASLHGALAKALINEFDELRSALEGL